MCFSDKYTCKLLHYHSCAFSRPLFDWMVFCVVCCYLPPSFIRTDTEKWFRGDGLDRVLPHNFQTVVFVAASYFPTVTTTMILLCKCHIFLVGDKVFLKSILKLKLTYVYCIKYNTHMVLCAEHKLRPPLSFYI